ncbi:MAG: hypothetical protein HYU67_06495 [Flavobacteriia bacterium]|nr:hypothetical protein [Flavobacteriia bacterium]
MKRIYHLKTCKTCQRILHELKPGHDIELIDIKENPIEEEILDWLKEKLGSYEALFSRKAMMYRKLKLHHIELKDEDYKMYMLSNYTFLKRPFVIYNDRISLGTNRDAVIESKRILGRL